MKETERIKMKQFPGLRGIPWQRQVIRCWQRHLRLGSRWVQVTTINTRDHIYKITNAITISVLGAKQF